MLGLKVNFKNHPGGTLLNQFDTTHHYHRFDFQVIKRSYENSVTARLN